ncbi:MAG: SET domain-containing protein-lysine N-methyltransferase [Candidatus Obscuribacterales bacterium]|nr:SET domain-containing protein-lysine N-methyltransferase [Candidatus Obscuribacterales bacterium]
MQTLEAQASQVLQSPAKILVKNARGVIQGLSPHAFQKLFGVSYTSRLLIDRGCPRSEPESEKFVLRKIPREHRRSFFERQFVEINDSEPTDACAMKVWLYGAKVRQAHVANVYIAKVSDQVGYGVFAMEDIPPGQWLGEYTGLARTCKDSDCTNAYVFNYVYGAVIDASKRGNFSRFINHSEQSPNARYMRVLVDDVVHVILLANEPIAKDEQILFDYGPDYWSTRHTPLDLNTNGSGRLPLEATLEAMKAL